MRHVYLNACKHATKSVHSYSPKAYISLALCECECVNEGKETEFKESMTFGESKRNRANRSAIDKSLFGFNSNLFIFVDAQVIQSFVEHVVFLMCTQHTMGNVL